jgi:hypothetical protein
VDDEQLIEPTTVDTPLTDDAAPELSSAVSDETVSGEAVSATETAAPEQAATPEFTSIRDWMGSEGFDTSRYQSDEDAARALMQRAQQLDRAAQEAAYWRHLAQQNQQQTPAPQPPPAAEKKSSWPQAPEWNPEWEQGLDYELDADGRRTGRIVARPGYDPTLPQKFAARKAWEKQALEKLTTNPGEAVWEELQDRIDAKLAEREQKILTTYQRDMEARNYFERQVMPRLYVTDPGTGQPRLDPATGQYAISPWGQAFSYYLNEASQMTPDPTQRRQYAENMANAYLAQQQLAPPVQPQAAAPQRGNTLRGAARNPSRSGTESAGTPQNAELPFYQKLQQSIEREYGSLEAADAAYSR